MIRLSVAGPSATQSASSLLAMLKHLSDRKETCFLPYGEWMLRRTGEWNSLDED